MKKGVILKNVALLASAKGLSQVVILAASPILTRLYSPEDLGVLAVFAVIIGLVGGLSCLRYEHSLPLARDDASAANTLALCGVILAAFVLLVCALLFAIEDDLVGWLNSPALAPYIWLLPVGVLGIGLAQLGRLWAIRTKAFKRVAATGVASSLLVVGLQISLGFLRFGPAGLILGRIGGIALSSILLLLPILKSAGSLARHVEWQGMVAVAKRQHQFPLFLTFSSGINTFGREMPILILTTFFGPAVTGLYALTRRMLKVPMTLVGQQVRKVFYSYAADNVQIEDLRRLTRSVFSGLVQLALPGTIILAVVAPALFALVFGERWTDSGVYAQWLCPWLFLTFICAPLTQLPLVLKRQGSELIFQVILLVARGIALIWGGLAEDVTLAIALFSVSSVLCWIGFLFWSTSLVGFTALQVLGVLGRELLVALPIVAPLLLARFLFLGPEDHLWLLAVGAACGLVAALVLAVRSRQLRALRFGSGKS